MVGCFVLYCFGFGFTEETAQPMYGNVFLFLQILNFALIHLKFAFV